MDWKSFSRVSSWNTWPRMCFMCISQWLSCLSTWSGSKVPIKSRDIPRRKFDTWWHLGSRQFGSKKPYNYLCHAYQINFHRRKSISQSVWFRKISARRCNFWAISIFFPNPRWPLSLLSHEIPSRRHLEHRRRHQHFHCTASYSFSAGGPSLLWGHFGHPPLLVEKSLATALAGTLCHLHGEIQIFAMRRLIERWNSLRTLAQNSIQLA